MSEDCGDGPRSGNMTNGNNDRENAIQGALYSWRARVMCRVRRFARGGLLSVYTIPPVVQGRIYRSRPNAELHKLDESHFAVSMIFSKVRLNAKT